MANYIATTEQFTATANAIRAKIGSSDSLEWDADTGYADDIAAIPNDELTAFLNRTLSGIYSNSRVTQLPMYAFYQCSGLLGVDLPACTVIGESAFRGCKVSIVNFPACQAVGAQAFYMCYSLKNISFPECTTIYNYAFAACLSLSSISFPLCTSIGEHAFRECYSLSFVSFPKCTTISRYAFQSCRSLKSVNFPACTTISTCAFYICSSLTSVSFPACTTIGDNAFTSCSSLTSVSFPACTTIGSYAFQSCYSLTAVVLSTSLTASSIYSAAFSRCYKLLSLYLLAGTRYSLQSVNVFSSTPISTYTTSTGGVNGSIFVKQSLYASYIAATNWVKYSARFVSLTDAQVAKVMKSGTHL